MIPLGLDLPVTREEAIKIFEQLEKRFAEEREEREKREQEEKQNKQK
ncbi:hypothetical protein [Staphylococcus intermedius]|uniref:Uncharacterized protein n=1 Tax=Staphylococcus intermedius NCTC 11048 TaxID=1141106 RepID=A0A380G7B6_STAIN|nr:hypothetical protein [Staphylococcus intermedius]SUM47029.1 Uncharacterised protein [Staphylococcus intermedius NCTC 11048]